MDKLSLIADTCVMHNVRAAARQVTDLYETALAPTGLTASQFSSLVAITQMRSAPITALAKALRMDRTTLSRVLAPMERRGLVVLKPDPDDGRSRRVSVTDPGRVLLREAEELWNHAQDEALRRMGATEWDEIRKALSKLSGR